MKTTPYTIWNLTWIISQAFANICVDDIKHLLTKGRILNTDTFYETKTKDVVGCAQVCLRWSGCKSFNYNSETSVCQTMPVSGSPSAAKQNTFVYSEIKDWPTQTDPDCYNRPCTGNEVCIPGSVTRGDPGGDSCSYSCFYNGRRCPLPVGGNPINQPRSVGSIFRHSCDRGFLGGVPESATCLVTGEWDKVVNTTCTPLYGSQCTQDEACLPIHGTCDDDTCGCGTDLEYDTTLADCVYKCPSTWFWYKKHCYLFVDLSYTFDETYIYCQQRKSSVLYLESDDENTFVIDHMQDILPSKNNNWDINEPQSEVHKCTVMEHARGYRWNDVPCNWPGAQVACKAPTGLQLASTD